MKRKLNKYTLHLTLLLFFLLIGVPILIFANIKSTDNRSRALASTTIHFSPSSSLSSPITATIGLNTSLDVYVVPNTNHVSYVSLDISYDASYFDFNSVTFVPNAESTLQLREGPIYSSGRVQVSFDIGSNAENALKQHTKLGTLNIKPIAKTPKKNYTKIQFETLTSALSLAPSDSAQENVLSNTLPAFVTIGNPSAGGGKGKGPR